MKEFKDISKLVIITMLLIVMYFVGALLSILLSPIAIGLLAYAVYKFNKDNKKE